MLESVLTRIFGLAAVWAVVCENPKKYWWRRGCATAGERTQPGQEALGPSSGQLYAASRTFYHLPHPPFQTPVSPRAASLKMQLPSASE